MWLDDRLVFTRRLRPLYDMAFSWLYLTVRFIIINNLTQRVVLWHGCLGLRRIRAQAWIKLAAQSNTLDFCLVRWLVCSIATYPPYAAASEVWSLWNVTAITHVTAPATFLDHWVQSQTVDLSWGPRSYHRDRTGVGAGGGGGGGGFPFGKLVHQVFFFYQSTFFFTTYSLQVTKLYQKFDICKMSNTFPVI